MRHRLALLSYDNLRDALCVNCADRNLETPALLIDPDHECALVQAAAGQQRQAQAQCDQACVG